MLDAMQIVGRHGLTNLPSNDRWAHNEFNELVEDLVAEGDQRL